MYKIILAFRYLFKRRISYLALGAVALCVFIVVVVMTVMTGLVGDFKQKNHDFSGDCVVGTDSLVGFPYYEDFVSRLEQSDFVAGVSAVIRSSGLISLAGSGWSGGVEIMGIDPVSHSIATEFGKTLYYRRDNIAKAFEPIYDANLAGCVLGIDFALGRDNNGGYFYEKSPAKKAFTVSCFPLTAKGALAKASTGVINTKTFYYSDLSKSGLARIDSTYVYLPFEDAQMLCGMDGHVKRANAIHIRFKEAGSEKANCAKVAAMWQKFVQEKNGQAQAELLDKVKVQDWKNFRRANIAAMEKEQTMMTLMFGLVGITTVFIIFVVFYMIISHKSKDIGILKSVGVSNSGVMTLFQGFALMIAIIGSAAGALAGWRFLVHINQIENWLFNHFGFQLWDRRIYSIGDIPHDIDLTVLTAIIISAIAACLVGAMVPSWRAARLKPAETLQVNQL